MTDLDLPTPSHTEGQSLLVPPADGRRQWLDYPRPQLVRAFWASLDGRWQYVSDDEDAGRAEGWATTPALFDRDIEVPFPPESEASGIAEREFHPVVWYRRQLTQAHLQAAGARKQGTRMLLHFGAVDYRAEVWLGETFLGAHEGGHTPFSFDITEVIADRALPLDLVVRADDDPLDVGQPRGKQDWQKTPHGIWYERTTGIWQPVWIEAVPELHITHLSWSADLAQGTVTLGLELNRRPGLQTRMTVQLRHGDDSLAEVTVTVTEPRSSHVITLPRQANGQAYESLLWDPEHPRLIDASITVNDDTVSSYLGLRSVRWDGGHFMLNDRPYYVRGILAQGYWPTSHLAAPTAEALRAEVQLAKDLGFNTIRMHQKVEDPRFLAWADRLGMLVWDEAPSTFEYSPTAAARLAREWIEVIRRDSSHPSVVTWVPLNESWGVQHIGHDPAQLAFARSLYHLTKALDPTRLVVSNDGWEQVESDLTTVHDYGVTGDELRANYADRSVLESMTSGVGPLGRRIRLLGPTEHSDRPVVVSEFGGVSYAPDHAGAGWGYATPETVEAFEQSLRDLFGALYASPVLAGFCYTQLADTLQEANGLTDAQRQPKLPIETIRAIVLGEGVDTAWQGRPKKPVEQPLVTTDGP